MEWPTVCFVVRKTVKLLLVDSDQRLLLVCGRDTAADLYHRYPVGGGIESDESPAQAASREAWEETGLQGLTSGAHVWTREATYTYSGQSYTVHETCIHRTLVTISQTCTRLAIRWRQSTSGVAPPHAERLPAPSNARAPLTSLLITTAVARQLGNQHRHTLRQ